MSDTYQRFVIRTKARGVFIRPSETDAAHASSTAVQQTELMDKARCAECRRPAYKHCHQLVKIFIDTRERLAMYRLQIPFSSLSYISIHHLIPRIVVSRLV
jgi:hypothetical protein